MGPYFNFAYLIYFPRNMYNNYKIVQAKITKLHCSSVEYLYNNHKTKDQSKI